jgi:hypothetical protein
VNRAPVHSCLAGAAVLAAAGLAAAGCSPGAPATAAALGARTSRTGPQTLSGSLTGRAALTNSPAIPLRLTGLVNTSAMVHLSSARQNPVTFATPRGNLAVRHAEGTESQKLLSGETCRFAFGQRYRYTVLGRRSTGAFRGATGSGTAVITFTGTLPKKGGRCDTSSSAQPSASGLRVSFVAYGPLTVR